MPKLRIAICAAFLTACGAAAEDPPGPIVLTPDPSALHATTSWAGEWSEATGISIVIGLHGIPVRLVEEIWATANHAYDHVPAPEIGATPLCGATIFDRGVDVWVDPTPPAKCHAGWRTALGHELGHVLMGRRADDSGHSDSGIMSAALQAGVVYAIDEASLSAVCETAPCLGFRPQ